MKLTRLELERFTVFEKAVFEFAPGANVIIGENGTGKSHLLKLIYCLNESVRRFTTGEGREGLDPSVRPPRLMDIFFETLSAVFQPEQLWNLIRRGGERHAKIRATWKSAEITHNVEFELSPPDMAGPHLASVPTLERSIFIPAYEVLSIFPGFISSYVRRESAFDRTIYDLCLALDARPLRQPPDYLFLEPIEDILGGKVVNEHGRFYLKLPDGNMEASLVAEGLRKIAMIDYLLINGSITPNGFLLWDEPEASLNPRLIRLVGHVALGLARSGVQTWVSTHDYLLSSEIALVSEQASTNDVAFFALARSSHPSEGTIIERGDRLADLQHNSILKALADLHDREQAAALE